MLVGVLSLLVTVLIGWQLLTLFDIKRIHADIANRDYEMWMMSEKNYAEYHMSMLLMYMARENKSQEEITNMYLSGLSAILHLSRRKDYALAEPVAQMLQNQLETLSFHQMSQERKKSLRQLLASIPDKDKIGNMDTLSAYLVLKCGV